MEPPGVTYPRLGMKHDIIVIGASAGGVEALGRVVSELPRDIRASVLVVLHVSRGRSLLPEILTRAGRLRAVHPEDGTSLEYSRIYVAPPDHHLIVEGGRARVVHTAPRTACGPRSIRCSDRQRGRTEAASSACC